MNYRKEWQVSDQDRLTQLEEEIAHLARTNEELSGEVLAQWKRIDVLEKALKTMETRLSGFEDSLEGPPTNERPPHW